jgi:hypothetical protein
LGKENTFSALSYCSITAHATKIQILTIEELFQGKKVDMPPQSQTSVAFAKAPRVSKKEAEQLSM